MTKLKMGSANATIKGPSGSSVFKFSEPVLTGSLTWQGDTNFSITQTGTIDSANQGTVGRIHILEDFYDESSTTSVCISASCVDSAGIDHVKVYYGGSTPLVINEVTQQDGTQGYWFDLEHGTIAEGETLEERKIYAELVPVNTGSVITRVTSKTIKVGTPTVVSLSPENTLTSATNLNKRLLDSTSDTVFELTSGIYYLGSPNGNPVLEQGWLKIRAAEGHDVELRAISSAPDSSYTFDRFSLFPLRGRHIVLENVTFNQWEYHAIGGYAYLGSNNVSFIDQTADYGYFPAFIPKNIKEGGETFYKQYLMGPLWTDGTNSGPTTRELHNSNIRTLVAGGASELFNVDIAVSFDLFWFEDTQGGDIFDNIVYNNVRHQAPYLPDTPSGDLDLFRLYLAALGPRTEFDVNTTVDDWRSIDNMVYTIIGINTLNPAKIEVTLDQEPSLPPPRFTVGVGWDVNVDGLFDWDFFKWANGDALTQANRQFVSKNDPDNSAYVIKWVDDEGPNPTNQITDVITFYNNQDSNADLRSAFNSLGLQVGDRISVGFWAHSDVIQTRDDSITSVTGLLIQDFSSVFEQQMLWQSQAAAVDVVLENCHFIEPTKTLGAYHLQVAKPQTFRSVFRTCTFPSNLLFLRTEGLEPSSFDLNLEGCVLNNIEGDSDDTRDWPGIQLTDCAHGAISNLAGFTNTNGTEWSGTIGVDDYGVPQIGGNVDHSIAGSFAALPYGIDGAARTAKAGATSAPGVSYVPRTSVDYFKEFPRMAGSYWSPTAGTPVVVYDGEIETSKVSPTISRKWYTFTAESGLIQLVDETSDTLDTTNIEVGTRIWCLVTNGDAKAWVDFGLIQSS